MRNYDVVKHFRAGVNKKGNNLFAEGNTLYSYNKSFPLVVRLKGDAISSPEKHCSTHIFLINGTRSSYTTNRHRSIALELFIDQPVIPFSLLHAAEIKIEECRILDWDRIAYGGTPCTSLIEHKPTGVHFLCGVDDGQWFLASLPTTSATNIWGAYQSLKPFEVISAELAGARVKRQGEWFFIPQEIDKYQMQLYKVRKKDWSSKFRLPASPGSPNVHEATKGIFCGDFYVKGYIRHRNSLTGLSTGQHRQLFLGDKIHLAVRNLALKSWTIEESID